MIASAVDDLPASFEQIAATQSNVGRMRSAGVDVSIGMIDDNDTRNLFMERQYAGNLVGSAEDPGRNRCQLGRSAGDDHLEAGAGDRDGRRDRQPRGGPAGRCGHLVGRSARGPSAAEQVYIDGVRQPLETHQTRLLQRYRYLPRRDLPEAYRR